MIMYLPSKSYSYSTPFPFLRLSALDPAFPGFYPAKVSIVKPISKDDAEFVDVIHTDAWLYGAPSSTGTVDFWPNGGRTLQPGCPRRNFRPLSDNGKLHSSQSILNIRIYCN